MKSCLVRRENYRSWRQKFCSDVCRNAYNNKINKDSTNFMRNVNNKLRKNYVIGSQSRWKSKLPELNY
jgi:hypothetical protein